MAELTVNMGYWQERIYARADKYDGDLQFAENAQKLTFLEGKMGARELAFATSNLPNTKAQNAGQ